MRHFLLLVLLTMLAAQGCDATWAGPSLPGRSHPIDVTQVTAQGPNDLGPAIAAATSLEQLRNQVLAHRRLQGKAVNACIAYPNLPDPCWYQVPGRPAQLYVTVLTNYECAAAIKEAWAAGGNNLYFIHWVGGPNEVCNASMAIPMWRLYSVPQSRLAMNRTVSVRMELQGAAHGEMEVQVPLG